MTDRNQYRICYFIYTALWFFLHTLCARFGDDTGPFSPFTWDLYINGKSAWSSRFFFSLFGTGLKRLPMPVWMLIDTAVIIVTILLLDAIFNEKKELKITLFLMGIFCLFPFHILYSAGWITTTVVYLWSITAGLYNILLAKKIAENKRVSAAEYGFAVPAFFCAVDVETGAVAIFVIFAGYSICQFMQKKKNSYVYILTTASFARILFDMVWKGNAARFASETKTWYPDYEMLNLLDRAVLGFSTACHAIYVVHWLPVLLLTFVLCMIMFEKRKDLFSKAVSMAALGIAAIYPLSYLFSGQYGYLYHMFSEYDDKYGMVSTSNYHQPDGYMMLFIWGAGLLCIVYTLVGIGDRIKSTFFGITVLIAGFGSKFIMGFTPTVAASGHRTASWLFFAILICLAGVYMEWETGNSKLKNVVACIIMLAGGITFLNSLFFACKY